MEEYVPEPIRKGFDDWYGDEGHLDPELHDLLRALHETELVLLQRSCSSRYFAEQPGLCARNGEAFISFLARDTFWANALMDAILEAVEFSDPEVSVQKTALVTSDETEVQWHLRFQPKALMWAEVEHELRGTPIDEEAVIVASRNSLRTAFTLAADICRSGDWRKRVGDDA